jgi:hypothetical protein
MRLPGWVALATVMAGCGGGGRPDLDPSLQRARWVATRDGGITVFQGRVTLLALTPGSPYRDLKPSWSPSGDRITFFRAIREEGPFETWRTKICVIAADGTGYRELTDGNHGDFNPTWTRDGSSRIVFNRYGEGGDPSLSQMYITSPDASPGDEVPLPHVGRSWQWVESALKDGRLFVDTASFDDPAMGAYLLAPDGAGGWSYEEVERPVDHFWHKLSVSPSETRVAYMLDDNGNIGQYADDTLYWAELDVTARVVKNPVAITQPTGGRCINEYPRWSSDEQFIIYDSSCRTGYPEVYAYRVTDGQVFLLAGSAGTSVFIACFENVPQ